MNGWSAKNVESKVAGVYAGVIANSPASVEWAIYSGGAVDGLVVKIKASSVTVVGSITAKLQTAVGSDWEDSKTVVISADGVFYIKLLGAKAADQTYLPLLNKGRIVITNTNAGDTATIDSVEILQQL